MKDIPNLEIKEMVPTNSLITMLMDGATSLDEILRAVHL